MRTLAERLRHGGSRLLLVVALGLVALVTAGCAGGDTAATDAADGDGGAPVAGRDGAGAPDEGGGADDGAIEEPAAGEGEGDAVSGAGFGQVTVPELRKIIRNAELELVVEDTADAFASIRRMAESAGGFVADANLVETGEAGRMRGTVVVRVPAADLDGTLDELEALAVDVRSQRVSTNDVTEEYVDVEAQLGNLRVLEAELQELLAEVREAGDENVDQLFTVFERLRQVRDQIDQLEGRRRLLDQRVALSTVTITLEPDPAPIAAVNENPWSPGEVLESAAATLVRALRGVGTAAIWIGVVVVPLGALLAAPFAAVWYVRRRRRPAASS